uniref:Uncharacterized protein n=1 Tax=Oryza glaberrima TaxID=4538 RepID=I1QRZ8_ORYGL
MESDTSGGGLNRSMAAINREMTRRGARVDGGRSDWRSNRWVGHFGRVAQTFRWSQEGEVAGIAKSLVYGEPGGGLSGQLDVSGEMINSSPGAWRFAHGTNSGWRVIFTKVEFVRVCVEYVYVVGYSLGLGVVIGIRSKLCVLSQPLKAVAKGASVEDQRLPDWPHYGPDPVSSKRTFSATVD